MKGTHKDNTVNNKRPVMLIDDLPWDWLMGEEKKLYL
jgi:hypothetical protein